MSLTLLKAGKSGIGDIAAMTTWQLLVESYKITGIADGAVVPQWDDVSGNARHLVEATNRPLYIATPANLPATCPAVRFDGTNDKLECATAGAAFVAGTTATLVIAGILRGLAPSANERLVVPRQNSQANDFDNPGSFMLYANSSVLLMSYRNNSGSSSGTMPTVDVPFVASVIYNGVTVQLFINGVARPTGANVGTFAVDRVLLGCGRGASTYNNFCQLDVVMQGVTNTALSSDVRSSIENALMARMGI